MQHLIESSRVKTFLVVFAFLLSLLACSSVQTEKTLPVPGENVANFPRMTIGDQWVTSTGEGIKSYKVIDVKADGSFIFEVKNEDGSLSFHLYFDNNYRLIKEINMTTGAIIKIPFPPAENLNFPLFVGKKWEDEYQAIGSDNKFKTFKNSYEIVSIEMVTTPAGTFNSFKIHRSFSATGNKRELDVYYWYSPEVKMVLKLQHSLHRLTASGYPMHIELLSYQKAPASEEAKQVGTEAVLPKDNNNAYGFKKDIISDTKRESSLKIGPIVGANWAVLVGISQYCDTRIPPLRYAAADARSFYEWIISPQGGKYPPQW